MKAAVLHSNNNLKIEEIEKPTIKDGEVLIRVKATGICGSDIPRVLKNGSHYYPNVLGHEFSGIVEETGEGVTHVKIGDKVSCAPLKPCHKCEDCLSGNHALCKHYSFIGSREFGAWAEYVKAPAINVIKLPDEISFIQGAFLEPTTVALHGLFLMNFTPMSTVAITGMGTIGLLTLQCAKLMGAKEITVFDIDDEKLKIAQQLGADNAINTQNDNVIELVNNLTNNKGFEMVIETAGVPETEILCLQIACNNGNVMYIGTPHREFKINPKEFEYINRKELTIKGSWMSYSAPFPGKEWKIGAYYLGNGQIDIDKIIGMIIPLQDINKAFELIEKNQVSGKVMMTLH